ncbi:MAG: dTMP kinase [Betaproteobacteria bacterium]|nr:dTMP kinase [Betaproteobacteria bacterium]
MFPHGRFITLEGIDGAGKSTHVAWLKDAIARRGHRVLVSREPGGTPLGEKLRELLLHQPMRPATEALLMFAARREHLETVIWPALEAGQWVLCDRFSDASFAYQGGGRGLAPERLHALENWVHGGFQPDLTLLFDLAPELGQARLAANRGPLDRFEQERADFHARVRDAYLVRAAADPQRIRVIDGSQDIATIRNELDFLLGEL